MLKNYFNIAWRNLLKKRLYSFINIGGLAVGLTCFILIALFVQHELSYDRFYENGDNIYRILLRQPGNDYKGRNMYAVTQAPLAKALAMEYPEVTHATAVDDGSMLISYNNKNYLEEGIWADENFFDVFKISFLQGNSSTALREPNSIILTKSLANEIFGNDDPIGKMVTDDQNNLLVTGIIQDLPANSSLRYDFITSILSREFYLRQSWSSSSYYTFFQLTEGASPEQLEIKLVDLLKKYQKNDAPLFPDEYFIQSLSEMYLYSDFNFDIGQKGRSSYVYLLSIIAVIVLILSCINYMNLSIARSINRVREVGMRKVIGASRWQLVTQFLGESTLIAFLALVLALIFSELLMPFFGTLVDRQIELDYLNNGFLIPGLLILVLVVGILSGSYPAFFMSRLRPIQVLKGKMEGSISSNKVQRILMVAQYVASMVLVTGSLVIYLQLQFIQKKELGFERDHIIAVEVPDFSSSYDELRTEWLRNPNILSVASSRYLPTNIASRTIINYEKDGDSYTGLDIYETHADYGFLDLFGIELIAGRDFSPEVVSDREEAYLINETTAGALGWTPEEAIGKQFNKNGIRTIIGVVKDFHMHSMRLAIEPLMIGFNDENMNYISIKVANQNLSETVDFLENTVKKYSIYPFEYQFVDEHFDQLYRSEIKMGETFSFFTLIALAIASMGLFGLAAYSAEQRTKEIGIRKVLGASNQTILAIFSKDFFGMVILAFLLSIPIAWMGMNQWLNDFAYRIDMEWWIFALAFVMALLITGVTISYQSIQAARVNPVDSLKSE